MKDVPLSLEDAIKLCEQNKHLIGTVEEKSDGSIRVIENLLIAPEDDLYQFHFFSHYILTNNYEYGLNNYKSYSVIAIVRHIQKDGELNYSYQVMSIPGSDLPSES